MRLTSENHGIGMSELVIILVAVTYLVTWSILIYTVVRLLFTVTRYLDRRR